MKKSHILGLILVIALIGAIISLSADYTSYENFESASARNKKVHVVGQLAKDKEMYYNPIEDPNFFSFYMIDELGNEKKVVYRSTKPQDFERSEQIVVVGKMMEEEFHASKILMKCPSKYIDDEIELKEVTAAR
ncbi:MAG: cytochrome c maturation protein CcmE [Bacteroidia bacterium]|nr:cytochrome c maturation protein CcmE [Bacteroidia bacterium]